jgi:hypothetical protein
MSARYATIPDVSIARVRRPVSVTLACASSVLLLLGLVVPGLVLGGLAVGAAWLPAPAPPADENG